MGQLEKQLNQITTQGAKAEKRHFAFVEELADLINVLESESGKEQIAGRSRKRFDGKVQELFATGMDSDSRVVEIYEKMVNIYKEIVWMAGDQLREVRLE